MNAQLFEALAVERVAMFVVLSIIILVAVFNILSSLIMLVRAKTRDIAILRTMGATRGALMRIFIDGRHDDRRARHGRGAACSASSSCIFRQARGELRRSSSPARICGIRRSAS